MASVAFGCGLPEAMNGGSSEASPLQNRAARSNEDWQRFAGQRTEQAAEAAAVSQLMVIEVARNHCEEQHDDPSGCQAFPLAAVGQAKARLSELIDWGVAHGSADDQVAWSALATQAMFEHGAGVLKDEWFAKIAERRVEDLAGAIQQSGSLEKAATDRQRVLCLFTSDPPEKGKARKAKLVFDRSEPRVYVHCAFPQPLRAYTRDKPDNATVSFFSIHRREDYMEADDTTVWSQANAGNLGQDSSIDFDISMPVLQDNVRNRMVDGEYRGKWMLVHLGYDITARAGSHVDNGEMVDDYGTTNLIRTFFLIRMRP